MYDFIALLRTDRWESLGYMEQHFQFIESLLHDKMQSHRKAHFFPCGLGGVRAAVMAWSNTVLSPSRVLAEHSRNLTAFT